MGPSAARRMASLTSSTLGAVSHQATRSTMEPQATGTRRASPSIFPSSSGMTFPMAFAAPVVVGMMLMAAARARRTSLCIWSHTTWSLV